MDNGQKLWAPNGQDCMSSPPKTTKEDILMKSALPTGKNFENVLKETIERVNKKLTQAQIQGLAGAFQTLYWEFPDLSMAMRLIVTKQGLFPSFPTSIVEEPHMRITTDSSVLNDAAFERTSFGIAFITGKLKVKGLHPLKLRKFIPLLKPFLESYREATENAKPSESKANQRTELPAYREADGDIEALVDKTIAIIGYGQLGRPIALNLRDATSAKIIVGNRDDASYGLAGEEGFQVYDIAEAVRQADVVLLLVPDEVQPEVMEESVSSNLQNGAAIVFASGHNLANDLIKFPKGIDVLLFAPRMFGEVIRRVYLENKGFLSYVSVEQDATGRAWKILLALAKGTGSLRCGALQVTARQEAMLDLFGEQALGPWLGAAILTAYQVGVEAGLPPEALLLELYLSGEMSQTFKAMAKYGFFRSVNLHGYAAAYGGMTRTMTVDRDMMAQSMRDALEDIHNGDFARGLQAEHRLGYPSMAFLKEILSPENPINKIEDSLGKRLGLDMLG